MHRHLISIILFAVAAAGAPSGERKNVPQLFGREQGVRDADRAAEAGDLRFIEITGGYVPDYPMFAAGGNVVMRDLWHYAVSQCGYRPPNRLADFQCRERLPDNNFPCPFVYDVQYVAAYNTTLYHHLETNPGLMLRFAVRDRAAGEYPEFPRADAGVMKRGDIIPASGRAIE